MRLVRLSVEHFQCIRSADLDFGPGLNVLYGPNDLGKSSLAWAIRAVLLLQHNAAAHERFVSWYGDGEPRVALTLCDDEDRYWRVTKTFGGAGRGRSHLESSKDGRSFTSEVSGRQVDDQLRTMLRWGIQRPGGQGPRGFPSSFLTQVLLAEQDNVPRVLFDGSLVKDSDDSGRLRLTEALNALAQDPMFKQVVDEAQSRVDVAFTPTGQKRRGRGSPFVEIADQLNSMLRERDELEAKIRDTVAAETRVRQVSLERDEQQRKLEEARAGLATAEAQLSARQRRDALRTQLEACLTGIRNVEDRERQIAGLDRQTGLLEATITAGEAALGEAMNAAQRSEGERDRARKRLDSLAHEDVGTDRRLRALGEQTSSAEEVLYQAERSVERAFESLRLARTAAAAVVQTIGLASTAAREAASADEAVARAAAAVERADRELESARGRLQELSSDDTRDRTRAELDNRRLTLDAKRVSAERELQVATDARKVLARAGSAETLRDALRKQLEGAEAALARLQAGLTVLTGERDRLRQVAVHGQAKQLREALAAAAQAAAAADLDRAQAAALRSKAAALRAQVLPDLAAAAEIASVRALRDELRIAEARLGGGLSMTVRPRRPLTLQFTVDGQARDPDRGGDETVVVAEKTLAVTIANLIDVEVTAGEESARQGATKLRRRWAKQGAALLARHRADTVEGLEALRERADADLRAAVAAERDADQNERVAGERDQPGQVAALGQQLEELERGLAGAGREDLARILAELGERWPAALQQRATDLDRRLQTHEAEIAGQRDQVTRLQAQLEIQVREAEERRGEASRVQGAGPGGWPAAAARHQEELTRAERDLAGIAAQLAALCDDRSGQDAAARGRLAIAEQALASAQAQRDERVARARRFRDGAVEAATRLSDARSRATELDQHSVWATALEASSSELSLVPWQQALTAAEENRDSRKRERAALGDEIARLEAERGAAIRSAREAYETSEERARLARSNVDERRSELQIRAEERARVQAALAELRIEVAGTNLDQARRTAETLAAELGLLERQVGALDLVEVSLLRTTVDRLAAQVRDSDTELAMARGALEQVGGAIVRDRQRDLDQALQQTRDREHEIEVEFDGWKLLVDTLRASESAEGAHLGRALAGPVSERFRSLTAGRYGRLELDAHLEATGLQVEGNVRDIGALSAGTQDQLATLLRVCIAEQLHSAIVLDDHLSQSDPDRIAWFNTVLRKAAQQVQIILITCRPSEVLTPDELPAVGEATHSAAAGLVRVVDMTRVISRYAPGSRA